MESKMDNKRSIICEVLCGLSKCGQSIVSCTGTKSARCRKLGKSFIDNMNDGQVDYVTSGLQQNLFLKACPGSGKTEVLAIKLAYEIEQWKLEHQGFAVLTFTNSAENEIVDRMQYYLDKKLTYPHYTGTFTSWLHGYIANPFLNKITEYIGDENGDKSIRVIESDCSSDFLNAYSSKYGYTELGNIRANEFYINYKTDEYIYSGNRSRNGKQILSDLLKQDGWRSGDLKKIKQRFWKNGFALYEDIEYLSCLLLIKYPEIAGMIAKRFPIIFVDECQDLSYVQLEILNQLLEKGCKIQLIGDLNQGIYRFRDIQPEDTEEFIKNNNIKSMLLKENYRSCQAIVNASEYVVNGENGITGKNEEKIDCPLIAILYSKGKEKDAIDKFDDYVNAGKLRVDESRIIVRNNNLKNKLLGIKNQKQSFNILEEMAEIIYLLEHEKSVSDYKTVFGLLAKNIQKIFFKSSEHLNSNFHYKPNELEMTEWKNILSIIRDKIKDAKQLTDFSVSWGKWKTQLDKFMKENICNLEFMDGCTYELGMIRKGNKEKKVEETLFNKIDGNLYYAIETIHGCKGMSLDAVLFMSAYQASNDEHSGGYWKQWFDLQSIGEENRLAYVAFSRARYLLAIGIPKPKSFSSEDRKILEDAGFKIIEE